MNTRIERKWIWVIGIIVGVAVIATALPYFLNSEKMRRYAETQMNRHLKGYTVHIGKAHFNPVAFSLLLQQVTLIQNANPNPPVADIRALKASLHWSELLRGHIVAEFLVDNPKVFMNLAHFRTEERSPVPLKKKGWQDAVQAIYPVKINHFQVSDGDFTYVDQGPYKPLHASHIDLLAANIRNVEDPKNPFPSSVSLKARIFEKGALTLDGKANFLEDPHMAFKGGISIEDVDLSYFEPLLNRNNLSVRSGILSTRGTVEYTPKVTSVNVDDIDINNMVANYIHLPQTAGAEKQRVHKAASSAGKYSNEPTAQVRINALKIRDSALAYVDRTAKPSYKIFFTGVSANLSGFTNQLKEGPSKVYVRGKFMGSGNTMVDGTFRPESKTMDLALKIAIDDTQMQTMKDIFRSAANFDVKSGLFSFYAEIRIQNDQVHGWVKPIFKDLKIGERQDKSNKNPLHKAYVGTAKMLAKVLENPPKKQVATKTDISGTIESPNASVMQIVSHLVENAWIHAILPGFKSETGNK